MHKPSLSFALFAFSVSLVVAGARAIAAAEDERPNVIFILADDLGWSDTTLFGTTEFYVTPNIERQPVPRWHNVALPH